MSGLAGDRVSAQEAERKGLVSKVFPPEQLVDEAVKVTCVAGFAVQPRTWRAYPATLPCSTLLHPAPLCHVCPNMRELGQPPEAVTIAALPRITFRAQPKNILLRLCGTRHIAQTGEKIAKLSQPIVTMAKEVVNKCMCLRMLDAAHIC